MKRVVLTGGTGFIGRETIAPLFARGFEVHLFGRTDRAPPGCTAHVCDLLRDDPAFLLSRLAPTHLLHLAWFAEPGRFWHARENLDWLAASLKLVTAFAAAGGSRVVGAGSCAEYAWDVAILDEKTTPLVPATLYGVAKAALFNILESAAPVLGISLGWGRVFFPYGPRERSGRLLADVVDNVAGGRRVACSDGLQSRDFLHVDDAAAAFASLLDSDVTGAVNIASGQLTQVRDLVTLAAALAGDPGLIDWGARPRQAGEPATMAATTERLHSTLGFRPKWSLEGGVADMVARRLAV